jgi:hypothetical protein
MDRPTGRDLESGGDSMLDKQGARRAGPEAPNETRHETRPNTALSARQVPPKYLSVVSGSGPKGRGGRSPVRGMKLTHDEEGAPIERKDDTGD